MDSDALRDMPPETLIKKLRFPGMVVFEVDAGWNGLNTYAFAPLDKH